MLVDQQNIRGFHQFVRQLVHKWRVVEQHGHASVMCGLRGGDNGGNRALQTQSQYRAFGDGRAM